MASYIESGYIVDGYTQDSISVNWATKVIFVPRTYLTLIQPYPTEIRELNLNNFRLILKSLEDDEDGISYLQTHIHNTEVLLGGIVYARVIEIINDYTITFEDGQYAVNLVGANSNVGDRVNLNQVSVRSANSAGLISNQAIEYSSYNGGITVDANNGVAGTVFPIGTPQQPVNNIIDARLIADFRGFNTLYIRGTFLFDTGDDVANFLLIGEASSKTLMVFNSGSTTNNVIIENTTVTGEFDTQADFNNCLLRDIDFVQANIHDCILEGTIILAGTGLSSLYNCSDGRVEDVPPPSINFNGSGKGLAIRNYTGDLALINKTGPENVEINIGTGGHILIDSTVTDGLIRLSGIIKVTDNSTGTAVVDTRDVIYPELIQLAAFGAQIHIDTINGAPGIKFPLGTEQFPCNNLIDAMAIAAIRNIETLRFMGDWTFTNGTFINGFLVGGAGIQSSTFTFEAGSVLYNCTIQNAKCTGDITGVIGFDNCVIIDMGSTNPAPSSQDIIVRNSLLEGNISVTSGYTGTVKLLNCKSGLTGIRNSVLNIKNANCKLLIRDYTGGLEFINSNQNVSASIDMASGNVILNPTISAGTFTIRGISNLTDNSTGTTIVHSTGLMEPERINTLAYQGAIHILSGSTYSGTIFPVGTKEYPVDNIEDAKAIGVYRGIDTLEFMGDFFIPDNTILDDLILQSHVWSILTMGTNVSMYNTTFNKLYLYGEFDAKYCVLDDCWIGEVTNFAGWIRTCSLEILSLAPYNEVSLGQSWLDNCASMYPDAIPVINMNTDTQIITNNTYDTLEIRNLTTGSLAVIQTLTSIVIIDSSCTGGDIIIRGVGTFINNSNGPIVNTESLVEPERINTLAFEDAVHLLSGSTYSGTTFPVGTKKYPVNNIQDALLIANERSISRLLFNGNWTFSSTEYINEFLIEGSATQYSTLRFTAGGLFPKCTIKNATVTGDISGLIGFKDCHLIDIGSTIQTPTTQSIIADRCLIDGRIFMPPYYSGVFKMLNCWSGVPGSTTPVFDMGYSNVTLLVRDYIGGIKFTNFSGSTDNSIDMSSGNVIFDSTLSGGTFVLRGISKYTDNSSSGCTIDVTGLLDPQNLVVSGGSGTFTGTCDTQLIAEAVWNELTSNNNDTGTFGAMIQSLLNKANESQHTLNVQTEMLKNKPNNP